MARYVVAVSGGVDSVVLLDMLAKQKQQLVVAHFDHGIRDDSAQDAEFVRRLAAAYGVPYETKREELGARASEDYARERRYGFLRDIAKKHNAMIVTAHHSDDIIETVAINMSRGTGWRGLAVLDNSHIYRPLLSMTKAEIIGYAKANGLKWHEDSTNASNKYLRNQLRRRLETMDKETKREILALWAGQRELKRAIDSEAGDLVGPLPCSRYFFTHCGDVVAIELLRAVFIRLIGTSPTIPQRQRALHAIKTAKTGHVCDVAKDIKLRFTQTEFVVEHRGKVLS